MNVTKINFTPEQLEELNQEVTVTMPTKYWDAVLVGLEILCDTSRSEIEDLKKKNVDYKSLSHSETLGVVAPMFARGILVKALTEAGVMTEKANAGIGIDNILAIAEKFKKSQQQTDQNSPPV